jgi:hypothetical protein
MRTVNVTFRLDEGDESLSEEHIQLAVGEKLEGETVYVQNRMGTQRIAASIESVEKVVVGEDDAEEATSSG